MELFAESENHIYIALLRILHAMQEGRRFYRYREIGRASCRERV